MARLRDLRPGTGRRLLIVDDDAELRRVTTQLLQHEGHEVRSAADPQAGIELARTFEPHVVLLDYYMPGGTGADAVRALRMFNNMTQVVLVTGYASEQPARRLLAELDIQGYHDKADAPERLLVQIDAALKHYDALWRVETQRRYLQHIVTVSRDITRLRPAHEVLLHGLHHLSQLLRAGSGSVAGDNDGLFVLDTAGEGLGVHAAIGRFAGTRALATLPTPVAEIVRAGLEATAPSWHPAGFVVVPLSMRNAERGCMIVEAPALPEDAREFCVIYGQQVVQALETVLLFERATVDPLTGAYTRQFGQQRIEEALKLGSRTGTPTSVVLYDIDHFKQVNDTFGHSAGDRMLRAVGSALRSACRTTDSVARYGGEEILVILPATDAPGAELVAERLRALVAATAVAFEGRALHVTVSGGVATAEAGDLGAGSLVRRADLALYRAKAEGRNRICPCTPRIHGDLRTAS